MDHIEGHTPSYLSYERFRADAPAAHAALIALSKSAGDGGLDKPLTELVKIRVSQINGCAFCLQHHLTLARALKVPAAKLDLVAVWREAGIFSPRERAALSWGELLAGMPSHPLPDDAYPALLQHFSETEALFLTVAIAAISAWNRIAGALRFPPAVPVSVAS
jgi:AhpD family alkylhydroperoxidase